MKDELRRDLIEIYKRYGFEIAKSKDNEDVLVFNHP